MIAQEFMWLPIQILFSYLLILANRIRGITTDSYSIYV